MTPELFADAEQREADRFLDLAYNQEAYEVLAGLVVRVAARLDDGAKGDPPAARALKLLVENEIVPEVAYEFIQRFGWPPHEQ